MEQCNLTIYKASAGSGKTYCLTANYLTRIFRTKHSYRKILAVTFTNKAAGEIKEKILKQLLSLSRGDRTSMSETLQENTGKSQDTIAAEAGEILKTILHDYSSFYVGTIDSFFQRILKSFTREIGLQQGYTIELDHSLILKNAVDKMLDGSGNDQILLNWLIEYVRNRAEEGKGWNLRSDILSLANEIFKEKFRMLTDEERQKLRNREFLTNYVKDMRSIIRSFEKDLMDFAQKASSLIQKHSVDDKMFFRGERGGIPSFIKIMKGGATGTYKPLTATVRQILDSPPIWSSKGGPPQALQAALNDGLAIILTDAVKYYDSHYRNVNTARIILENIYILGILADVLDQVHYITSSENRFLLSDAGELLYLIIGNDQTPFIYEKAGNAFENFLIDEFQDTSHIQWNNFRPLIMNSLSEGNDNLIVGDVKQSIYRWRNSDWSILSSGVQRETDPQRTILKNLDTNWRSRKNIIAFNNALFSVLPGRIDELHENREGDRLLVSLYQESDQNYPGNKEDGLIRIEFIGEEDDRKFQEISLSRLPGLIESLNDRGYYGSDIGILVRKNEEGAAVLKTFLDYQSGIDVEKKRKYCYNIISSESILLSASNVINLIIHVLYSVHSREENLNNAMVSRFWSLFRGGDQTLPGVLPEGYERLIDDIGKLSIFEAVEKIIGFFGIGDHPENVAYLNAFQDYVIEYSGNTSSDITSFLKWWETTGIKKSIVLNDNRETMRVLTIHKAKGLEFRIVIIPFISWPVGHGRKNPVMWVNPGSHPFSQLSMVPVKFKSDLLNTSFESDYRNEEYYAAVDNLNLLYVAFTRAIDGMYGYCSGDSGSISEILLKTFSVPGSSSHSKQHLDLNGHLNKDLQLFEYGSLPPGDKAKSHFSSSEIVQKTYFVNIGNSNFNLKLHGESWIVRGMNDKGKVLNYGKVMHEAFEFIYSPDDVESSVNRLITEGKLPKVDKDQIVNKLYEAISGPVAGEWFRPGLKVLNEAELLLPDGTVKRPDRVIINGKDAIVIDFKFGEETAANMRQVRQYRDLLLEMGYDNCTAFLWYLETNKIITV